jgi:hypothetical protein
VAPRACLPKAAKRTPSEACSEVAGPAKEFLLEEIAAGIVYSGSLKLTVICVWISTGSPFSR